jgi:Tfp pilus assembly pilus retraction ATPase PilT
MWTLPRARRLGFAAFYLLVCLKVPWISLVLRPSAPKQGASDLHLSAGLPPMIQVDGDVRRINLPALNHKQVHALIYDIMNDQTAQDFEDL